MKLLTLTELKQLKNTAFILNGSGCRHLLTPEQEEKLQAIERAIKIHEEYYGSLGEEPIN